MKQLVLAALAGAALISQPAQARWYVAHLGGETCVPLNDVGADWQRLYYGTGPFSRPEDLARYFQAIGARVVPQNVHGQEAYMRAYHVTDGNADTYVVMFHEKPVCEAAMAAVANDR